MSPLASDSICLCQSLPEEELPSDYPRVARDFAFVRSQCQALRELLVPDEDWLDFQRYMVQDADELHHSPALMLAFMRQHLYKITSPIHRYLFRDGLIHPSVTNQYRQDLREKWMRETDLLQRHRKFNMFMGKMAELQLIHWLENDQGWQMSHLSALGGPCDISAVKPIEGPSNVEVKFVGQTLEGIIMILNGVGGNRAAAAQLQPFVDPNTNHFANLISRFETAIRKVENFEGHRIALVIVSEVAWRDFTFVFGPQNWRPLLKSYLDAADPRVDEKLLVVGQAGMDFQFF